VCDLFLLLGLRRLLQNHLFGTHVFELAVVTAIAHQFAVVDMQGDIGHGIQKLAVMADHHHGAGILFEPGFEPDQGVQIQVVGRFIEQQQVRRAHQRARQLQTHAPATREAVHRLLQFSHAETQPQNQGLGPRWRIVLTRVIQCGIGMCHAHVIFTGFGLGNFAPGGQQGGIAFDHKLGRGLRCLRHVLRHLGHTPLAGNRKIATVFVQAAVEDGKQ
jgi:hypothetical protein